MTALGVVDRRRHQRILRHDMNDTASPIRDAVPSVSRTGPVPARSLHFVLEAFARGWMSAALKAAGRSTWQDRPVFMM